MPFVEKKNIFYLTNFLFLLNMRTAILIFLVTISNFVNSQNITFDQAQNLRQKGLADVETFLTGKGWKMTEAEAATTEKMGMATFGYEVNRFDSKKATGWITFYESGVDNKYNRLTIQIHKSDLYSTYVSRLTANAYKLKSSKIEDGAILKVYQNSTTTCMVRTSTSEGTYTKSTTYSFILLNNTDYKLLYEDD